MRRAALALFAAAALGCTSNYSVLFLNNVEPGDKCTADPSSTTVVSSGTLDVTSPLPDGSLNPGYFLTPLVESSVSGKSVSDSNAGNPSAGVVYLGGADVEVRSSGSALSDRLVGALAAQGLDKARRLFTVVLKPGAQSGLVFSAIDAEQTSALAGALGQDEFTEVVVHATLFGTVDGENVSSVPIDYPIMVCNGCYLRDLGLCADIPAGTVSEQGGTCGPLQDAALSCCTQATGDVVCPAPDTSSM